MNNIDSFSDADLLNLVDRTIIQQTNYTLEKYTGSCLSVTTAYGNRVTNYRVTLFFGYKNDGKTSISRVIDIDKELYFIWAKAIMIKTLSLQVNDIGNTLNELNQLIKPMTDEEQKEIDKRKEENDRTVSARDTASTLPLPFTFIPNTSVPNTLCAEEIEILNNFIDLKHLLQEQNKNKDGNHYVYVWDGKEVSISDTGKAYYKTVGNKNLSPAESDRFFQFLYAQIKGQK